MTTHALNVTDASCEFQYDFSVMSYLFGAFTVDHVATEVLPLRMVVAINKREQPKLLRDYMKLTCLKLYALIHNA